MPVPLYSASEQRIKDHIVGDTATDPPFTAAQILRAYNRAYAMVWEISGGAIIPATSFTLWTVPATPTGVVDGILSGVRDIKHLFAHTGASGVAYTDSTTVEVERTEQAEILALRKSSLTGGYTNPKRYSITRLQPSSPATAAANTVGLLQLDYWPHTATKFEFPALYLTEFVEITTGAPNVNDLEAHDIEWIAAADLSARMDRTDLVPGMLMNVSETTTAALGRKLKTLMSGDQDDN